MPFTTVTDTADLYPWAQKVSIFDSSGSRIEVNLTFDDGRIRTTTFSDGVITRQSWTDPLDAAAWGSMVKTYDVTGALEQLVSTLDDGTVRTTTYTAGQRVQNDWTDVDNAQSWSTKSATYDSVGRIIAMDVTYDDGRMAASTYLDGSRIEENLTFDDGRIRTTTFSDGVITRQSWTDPLDAAAWGSIERIYDINDGSVLYTHRTQDDGSQTFVHVDGQQFVTGGTFATVAENAAPELQATDTIALVEGYRGSTTFTAITSVVGNNGYGIFTLGTGGTWTYSANNDQAAIQGLNLGDTLTDSFSAITTDGVEATVTTAIVGTVFVNAPVFVGNVLQRLGSAGNSAASGTTNDLRALFTYDYGDSLTFTATDLPTGVTLANGVLRVTDPSVLALAGDYTTTVTATGKDGASTSQEVILAVAMENDFRDSFGLGSVEVVDGSSASDTITFGDRAAAYSGTVRVDGGDGADTITFGNNAGDVLGTVGVDGGDGIDTITFGDGAQNLIIDLGASDGDADTLTFEGAVSDAVIKNYEVGTDTITIAQRSDWNGGDNGTDTIFTAAGGQSFALTGVTGVAIADILPGARINDAPTFIGNTELAAGAAGSLAVAQTQDLSGLFADVDGDPLTFTAGGLLDGFSFSPEGILTLQNLVSVGDTVITVTADDGRGGMVTQDVTITIALENDFRDSFGRASVEDIAGSSISDTITFGFLAGSIGGSASVDGGDGADTITFGRYAGYVGSITVDGGDDADMITFENFAGYEGGSVSVDGGEGADTITFGELAGTLRGSVSVDGGESADTITFGNLAGVGVDPNDRGTGSVSVEGGDGADTISFGDEAATVGGSVTVDGGGDGDLITFGNDAGFRGGSVTVDGGDGADTIMFGANARNLTIDLGADDGAADTLTFQGFVRRATIENWELGIDTINVAQPSSWSGADTGTDTVFTTADDQSFTVIGVTGVAISDILPGANTAPTLIGSPVLANGAVGSFAAAFSQDLSTLFTDANGDALTFTATGLPAGFALSSAGVLTLVDLGAAGDTVITVTADDGLGGTVTQDVAITVALENDFGDVFGSGSVEVVDGASISDTITFGNLAGSDGGSVTVGGGGGVDTITFGGTAGYSGGSVIVDGGDDADTITFGRYAGYVGSITVDGGGGGDLITFGYNPGSRGGAVTVDSGDGADTIMFGVGAGYEGGSVSVDGGGGADTITFGDYAGYFGGSVIVDGGDDADTITFGRNAGYLGSVTVDGGGGVDTITFGANARNLTIDLGADDGAADTLTFRSDVSLATIENWEQGIDTINVAQPSSWSGADTGTDTVFTTADGQSFTVIGVTGVAISDILPGANAAPTLIGSPVLANGAVGSFAAAFSQDLSTLFTDANGDALTFTAIGLPAGFALSPAAVLTLVDTEALDLVGDTVITVTADDGRGGTVTQDVAITVALENDFGDDFGRGSVEVVDGASISDTITFGYNAGHEGGAISVDGGEGADTITFGVNAGFRGGSVIVDGGDDADTITFGRYAGRSYGTVSVDAGNGADTVTFGDGAGNGGSVTVDGGEGADTITFRDGANNLTIDLGADDGAADTLTFQGTIRNTTIENWEQGTDTINVAQPSAWQVFDNGSDAVFTTADGQSFTVIGVTGAAISDILPGANVAPTFTGSPVLASGAVGSLAATFSQDLSTLFTDANGDALTFTATGLSAGFALSSAGVLTLVDLAAAGDTVITVTADDGRGGTVTQDVAITVALENDFGDVFGHGSVEVVDGASLSDTITFGHSAGERGSVTVDGGDGADTITFGFIAGPGSDGSVSVDGGDGADTITFGDSAAFRFGSVSVDGGDGSDMITFGDDAGDGRGSISVDGGEGADTITFGEEAGRGGRRVSVDGGDGADTITFGNLAQNLTIDLGADDADANTLTFLGSVNDATIANWEQGLDLVDVVNEGAWSIIGDDGAETTLSDGASTITFLNITGLTDVDDFLF